MTELAHLTLSELPGTVLIWASGIGLGIVLASSSARSWASRLWKTLRGTLSAGPGPTR